MTGVFAGTATFGEGEANEIELSEPSGVFVAKYDRNGLLRWATSAAGFQASGIATDSRRNSYVTGDFLGTATFGEGEPNETVLEAGASADVFVAKYDRNGLLRWATKQRRQEAASKPMALLRTARAKAT